MSLVVEDRRREHALHRARRAEHRAGLVHRHDTATEKPSKGEVVAVGKGKLLESGEIRPLDLKKGDKVLFGKYSGTEVKIDGEDLLVMREDDVMAVIEK